MGFGIDMAAIDIADDPGLLFMAEKLPEEGFVGAFGRMAIVGTAEVEEAGVGANEGDVAEAGLEPELENSWLRVVVMDNVRNGAASALPESSAEF